MIRQPESQREACWRLPRKGITSYDIRSKISIINSGQRGKFKAKEKKTYIVQSLFFNLRSLFFNMRTRDMMQAYTYKGIQLTAGGCEIMTVNLISEQGAQFLRAGSPVGRFFLTSLPCPLPGTFNERLSGLTEDSGKLEWISSSSTIQFINQIAISYYIWI